MNESVPQYSLLYQSPTSPSPILRPPESPMPDSIWNHSHSSPTTSSPTSGYPPHPFPIPNGPSEHPAYTSPTSTTFPHHSSPDVFPRSSASPSSVDAAFNQVESSVGPARATARRPRAATNSALHLPSRRDAHSPEGAHEDGERNAIYYLPTSASRPQSPTDAATQPMQGMQPQRPSLTMSTHPIAIPGQPTRYPSSPGSLSPVYTPYMVGYMSHSRSNSDSHSGPRSTSPALSAASNRTSEASSGSANATTQPTQPRQPVAPPAPDRPKQRKQRLFNVDRKAICVYHLQYPNARQEDIAQRYGVERSTISKILKQKQKWMNVPEAENLRVAKHRPSKFPEIEEELIKWLVEATAGGHQLTDASIRSQAKQAAQRLRIGEDKFKASSGWIENFKHRHSIRKGKWQGQHRQISVADAQLERRLNPNLPPMNPTFDSRPNSGDELDLGLHQHGSPGSVGSMRRGISDAGSPPSMSLHSPWQQRSPDSANNLSLASHVHDTSISHNLQHHPHPHQSTAPTLQLEDLNHRHQPRHTHPQSPGSDRPLMVTHSSYGNGYDPPVVSSEPPLDGFSSVPSLATLPTLNSAVEGLSTLTFYLDAQPNGFVTQDERQILSQIRGRLIQHQHGNGLYDAPA